MKLYSKKIVALGILAALVVGACGDDEPSKAPSAISANCGNGTVDTGEECDGTNLNGADCRSATMGASPSGALSCASCEFVLTGCTGAPGAGGRPGTGGSGS